MGMHHGGDTPSISASSYTTAVYSPLGAGGGLKAQGQNAGFVGAAAFGGGGWDKVVRENDVTRRIDAFMLQEAAVAQQANNQKSTNQEKIQMAAPTRRLVQVFIADTNESVPLAESLLYSGEQKLTDLTDQELFFEIEIKSLLDAHNVKRVTWADKTVKDRVQMLEPARIRDLRMVVVNVAQF
jgi:hypothetical protein